MSLNSSAILYTENNAISIGNHIWNISIAKENGDIYDIIINDNSHEVYCININGNQ